MMDALRYAVQGIKELDVFGGKFFEQPGSEISGDYVEDWSKVWVR
jgi:hypothetical protein